MPDFSLRPLSEADLPAVLEVYRQCEDFLALGPAKIATAEMARADMALTRPHGGQYCGIFVPVGADLRVRPGRLVGVVDFIADYEGRVGEVFIELLMIAAPYRRQGLGAAVVEYLAGLAGGQTRGGQITGGHTGPPIRAAVQVNNPAALAFWQRLGFRITGPAADQPDGTVTYLIERV